MEPEKAVKTLEELAEDRTGYLQRALQLEDELHNLKEREPQLRDELMQIRGALAYVEMTMNDLAKQQEELDKEFAAEAKKAAAESNEPEPGESGKPDEGAKEPDETP